MTRREWLSALRCQHSLTSAAEEGRDEASPACARPAMKALPIDLNRSPCGTRLASAATSGLPERCAALDSTDVMFCS